MAIEAHQLPLFLAEFRRFDAENSGAIRLHKFQAVLQVLMPCLSLADVRELMDSSDATYVYYNKFFEWLYSNKQMGEGAMLPLSLTDSPMKENGLCQPAHQNGVEVCDKVSSTPTSGLSPPLDFDVMAQALGGGKGMTRFADQLEKVADLIQNQVERVQHEGLGSLSTWLRLLVQAQSPEKRKSSNRRSRNSNGSKQSVGFTVGFSADGEGDEEADEDDDEEDDDSDLDSDCSMARRLADEEQRAVDSGPNLNQRKTMVMARRYAGGTDKDLEDLDSGSDIETNQVVPEFERPRGLGCSSDAYGAWNRRTPFVPPQHAKPAHWRRAIEAGLRSIEMCAQFTRFELKELITSVEVVPVEPGSVVMKAGESGDCMYVVLLGAVDIYIDDGPELEFVATLTKTRTFGERSLLASFPRAVTAIAKEGGTTQLGMLDRETFRNFILRREKQRRESRQEMLRNIKLMEMMSDEQIAKLTDVIAVQVYEEGDAIIHQGDKGDEFFIIESGEAVAEIETGQFSSDIQEHRRFQAGDLFGERTFLTGAPRGATIIACFRVEALILSRRKFKRLLGPLDLLQSEQYLTDPRKNCADFYTEGDARGPGGTLKLLGVEPDPATQTSWFVVYRPTSRDAIAKMLAGVAVGKGLNVKGKSAKKGLLSGLVPFIQISNNEHKDRVEIPMVNERVAIYYKSIEERDQAYKALAEVLKEDGMSDAMEHPEVRYLDGYATSGVFGLDVPEPLMHEAYIMRPDLTPMVGWETGRNSEPMFMDMNLHAIRGVSEPQVVLYQYDSENPMNPRGLLIAYAEEFVKPVVSDLDTFTVGSRGMKYNKLPEEQLDLARWSLEQTTMILNDGKDSWTALWLQVLQAAWEQGFHPVFPKYGYGDSTSYRLIENVVEATLGCGAVRHGAECFNFYFPQDLDDNFLVVWEGFPDIPWAYKTEPELREFLIERAQEGFAFPLNPVWPVRDRGWYEVLSALESNEDSAQVMDAWFVPGSGIRETIEMLYKQHPNGFDPREDEAQDAFPDDDMTAAERRSFMLADAKKKTIRMSTSRRTELGSLLEDQQFGTAGGGLGSPRFTQKANGSVNLASMSQVNGTLSPTAASESPQNAGPIPE